MPNIKPDSAETESLLEQARAGDDRAFDRLFAWHRQDLLAFVELRLDRKLRTRVDPSDVIQEAQLEAVRKLGDYLQRRPMPFRLWLRKTTCERPLMIHRRHLKAASRAIERGVPLPDHSSLGLARQLLPN
jgi:RNA polymerase sigma-70 factor (ECF subfamily)